MSITLSNGFLTELKTTTQTTNLQFGDLVGEINIGITSGSGGGGGGGNGTGSGEGVWYFYSDEGNINASAPTADGNAIFTIQGSPIVETFNPNKADGVTYLAFNLSDTNGNDYTDEFTNLANNNGTISVIQNGNTITYTSTTPGSYFVDNAGFFIIATTPCTQTATTASPFTYSDPISIIFECYSYTFGGTDVGQVVYLDCDGVQQTATYDGPSTSGYDQTIFCAKKIISVTYGTGTPTITSVC